MPRCLAIVDGCWLCPQSLEEINLPVHRWTLGRFSPTESSQSPLICSSLQRIELGAALIAAGLLNTLHTELNARFGHIPSDEQRDAHVLDCTKRGACS